jgi:hypothetical protein
VSDSDPAPERRYVRSGLSVESRVVSFRPARRGAPLRQLSSYVTLNSLFGNRFPYRSVIPSISVGGHDCKILYFQ